MKTPQQAKHNSFLPVAMLCVKSIKSTADSHVIKLIACQDIYSADFWKK